MELIYLIAALIVFVLTAWLIVSNYQLRQQNHELLIDKCNLSYEKSTLTWHLDKARHELKLFKAEFCTSKTKAKVGHDNTVAEN